MSLFEDIKRFLPQHLSAGDKKELFKRLKTFQNNSGVEHPIYTTYTHEDLLFQGDILRKQPVVFLPSNVINHSAVLILSNTCDIDPSNKRNHDIRITYAPIVRLVDYKERIKKRLDKTDQQIDDHVSDIRKQLVTNIFHLPGFGKFDESIVFFDTILNSRLGDEDEISNKVESRAFTLDQFGWYILLLKLSIHFTRMNDGVSRGFSN